MDAALFAACCPLVATQYTAGSVKVRGTCNMVERVGGPPVAEGD